MKTFLLSEMDELKRLLPEWDALAQQEPRDGFFRTPSWCLSWVESIRPDARPFVVAVRAPDGRLIGLAPLCLYRFADLGFRMTAVGFVGRDVVSGDFLDFLSLPGTRPAVLQVILDFLWQQRGQWDVLLLGELLRESDLHTALRSWAQQNALSFHEQEERICPYLDLPGSFDTYLASLSDSMRYHIRRRTRDILVKQGAQLEMVAGTSRFSGALDTLIRLHLARWRSQGRPGTLGKPGFSQFLQRVCASPPEGATPHLYLLKHRDHTVAALLAFHFGQSALYYQAGWDPESSLMRFSPGVVVMAQSVKDAIEQGLKYYEFLRGEEGYKFRWTKTYRRTITVLGARASLARGYVRALQAKDRLKRLLGRDQALIDPLYEAEAGKS